MVIQLAVHLLLYLIFVHSKSFIYLFDTFVTYIITFMLCSRSAWVRFTHQEHSLSFSPRFCIFENNKISDWQKPYDLANEKLCYFKIYHNIEKIWVCIHQHFQVKNNYFVIFSKILCI